MKRPIGFLLSAALGLALAGQVFTATGQENPADMLLEMKNLIQGNRQPLVSGFPYPVPGYRSQSSYIPEVMHGYRQWPGYEIPYIMPGYETRHVLPGDPPPHGIGVVCIFGNELYTYGGVRKHDDGLLKICLCSSIIRSCEWHPYTSK